MGLGTESVVWQQVCILLIEGRNLPGLSKDLKRGGCQEEGIK